MKFFIAILVLLLISPLTAQRQIYESGFSNQERIAVLQKIKQFEPLFQRSPTKEMAVDLADAFVYIKKYKKAISYYEYALEQSPLNERQTANYFSALFEFGDLSLAQTIAEEYFVRFQKRSLKAKLDSFENLSKAKPVKIENLQAINTENNEYGMYPLFADYKILNSDFVLGAGKDAKSSNFMNPTIVSLNYKFGESARQFSMIDNDKYIYTITHFDPVENKVYVTRSTSTNFSVSQLSNNVSTMKMYIATMDKFFKLGELVPFQYNSSSYSVGHASVSKNGQVLYFVSDMPGGYGGTDIYRCMKLEDGSWGYPINLGPLVNTSSDEMFPNISPSGNVLYFSSSGNSILGGLDINKTYRSRANVFSKPINLGAPFNSNKDDFGLIYIDDDGEEGYFSSNRLEGLGGVDVYKYEYEVKKKKTVKKEYIAFKNGKKLQTIGGSSTDKSDAVDEIQDEFIDFRFKKKLKEAVSEEVSPQRKNPASQAAMKPKLEVEESETPDEVSGELELKPRKMTNKSKMSIDN